MVISSCRHTRLNLKAQVMFTDKLNFTDDKGEKRRKQVKLMIIVKNDK